MRPQKKKSRRQSAPRLSIQSQQDPPRLSHYPSLNDLQPTVRPALHHQPTELKSNSYHEPTLPHHESYQSLPSVIAAELSFSSSTSNNNSVSPTVRNIPALRKNLSLGALHHKYPLKFNKGSFVNATTFSAPISPKYLDKLPPIHKTKNTMKRHIGPHTRHPPLSSNGTNSSMSPRPFGINPYHDALLVNNRCNKICEDQETDDCVHSLGPVHSKNVRNKSKPLRSRRKMTNPKARKSNQKQGFKRIQSMPSLNLDLSRLSIEEHSTKLHTHHGAHGQVNNLKLTFPDALCAVPKSARPSMSSINAEGIKSNIALQFDLAPKSIDHRSSYDITADGAFHQNGFTVCSTGMTIDGDSESPRKKRYDVKPSDFVEVSILGRGSSSVVYKSWDLKHQRFIALKCISAFEQDKRRQIMNELGLLTNNNCPEIVPFYGSYFDSGQIIFCLEYFDIGSLQELIEINGTIPDHIVSYIMARIISAVEFLHSQKRIIYRDIKPSNILIHSNGTVKLSDFGIIHQCAVPQCPLENPPEGPFEDPATLLDLDNQRSMSSYSSDDLSSFCNEVIGTTIYMSPQRLSGKQYSFLSDIWSIGLCVAQSLHPQFPLFINYSDSTDLIQQYVLSATQPIYKFFPKEVSIVQMIADFMDQCLRNEESQRWSAKQLLEHEFIAGNLTLKPSEFQAYIAGSKMGILQREKAKLELVSIKQSLSQLVIQNKISREAMNIAVKEIQEKSDGGF